MPRNCCSGLFCCCFNRKRKSTERTPLREGQDSSSSSVDEDIYTHFDKKKFLKTNTSYKDGSTKQFIEFSHTDINSNPITYGWKCHVSIGSDKDSIGKATSLLFPILAKYRVQDFKVARPSRFPEAGGRIITFYFTDERSKPENLSELFQEIEDVLAKNNIPLGQKVQADAPITNAQYLSYRCDYKEVTYEEKGEGSTTDRIYLSAEEAMTAASETGKSPHNPYEYDDFFGLSKISLNARPTLSVEEEKPLMPSFR